MSLLENYDDVLDQMQAFGLEFAARDLPLDTTGKIRRCGIVGDRERRGWYVLHELRLDNGTMVLVGSFGIWQGQDNNKQDIELKRQKLSPEQKAAMRKRLAADRKSAAAARKKEGERAAMRAEKMWMKCKDSWTPEGGVPISETSYTKRKKINPYNARFTPEGALVVPMMDVAGKVHGLQFILSRDTHAKRIKRTGRDKEGWPAGHTQKGHFLLLGSPLATNIIIVTEGYATGDTIFEALGEKISVAVAFSANNLEPVASALRQRYKMARILFAADDDAYGKCQECKKLTPTPAPTCVHCGADHSSKQNAGATAAELATLAVRNSAWILPKFPDSEGREKAAFNQSRKISDFNDLHVIEGLHLVRDQIQEKLDGLGWDASIEAGAAPPTWGAGDAMPPQLTVQEAVHRYYGTYGLGGDALFDRIDRRLVHKKDVLNLLPRHGWDDLRTHPQWEVVREKEIGFDATGEDKHIKANMYGGWPTTPKEGKCTALLSLLEYLCSNEDNSEEIYNWIIKWLAYPVQHHGAKMQSSIVVHGPQGTGKSRFFEAYSKIFGDMGLVLGQEALEDKFNADWAEKKLFILADEVLARQDMYHIKNRLKGFITGSTIRVNPKNVAAHNEKNQMNIVFLSNERQPLVLENDDRRHCVIWVPPKLNPSFFEEVNEEIDNGGIEALHYFLTRIDLGDFKPWTHPPASSSKQDLVELGLSSEERFMHEWIAGDIDNDQGETYPLCPCLGSDLYAVYDRWCTQHGERKRAMKDLISMVGKRPGWSAGKSVPTYLTLKDKTVKNRKMVVPAAIELSNSVAQRSGQAKYLREKYETNAEWLTVGFFDFERIVGK